MFNLDQALAAWRRQMLATGIKTPVPLDELEGHLRDDVEQQVRSGLDAQRAFEVATQRLGRSDLLKAEFAKTDGFFAWFGENGTARFNQILGALWLAQCLWFLIYIASSPAVYQVLLIPEIWFALIFFTTMYSAGVFGSILLFRGAKPGPSIIRIIALLDFILSVTREGSFGPLKHWAGILSVFDLITIWLLRSPSGTSRKTVTD